MVTLSHQNREAAEIFFSLLEFTSEWSIANFTLMATPDHGINDYWADIASISTTNGYIRLLVVIKWLGQLNSETVRKVWEISDQTMVLAGAPPPTMLRGGRGADDSQAEWELVEAALLQ